MRKISQELIYFMIAAIVTITGIGQLLAGRSLFEAFFSASFLGIILVFAVVLMSPKVKQRKD